MLLRRQVDRDADREDREHRGEHHPRMPARQHDLPEHEHLRRRDQEDRQHLEEVREAVRVLERHCGVRVVVPAAVRPQLLDRDLRCDGTAGDRLVRPLQRRRRRVRVEGLRHTLRDEQHTEDDREGQQDVDERAIEVAPEVPEAVARAARNAAHHCDQHGHPDRRRDEVLYGEAGHLREVGHRVLAAVELPVGVRDKARGRVDRDVRRDALHVVRVQEEVALQPLDRIEDRREPDAEDEHRLRVRLPVLLLAAAPSQQAQEAALDRVELLAAIGAGHEHPERVAERDQGDGVEEDLGDALGAHERSTAVRRGRARRPDRRRRERHDEPEGVGRRHQTFSIT